MATSDKRHAELHAFDFSGIESKLDSSFACLNVIEKEVSIGLLPKYLGNENEFIKLVLDKKLGKFDDRLQCIPVKVRKIKKLGSTGIISGEDPCIYFKILAELIVFQPAVASQVAARVDKISHSHIGLLVHEWFNASISKNEKQTIPEISVGDEVLLEVIRSTVTRRILSLKGKFIKILKKTEGEPEPEQQECVNGNLDEDAELQKPVTKKTKHREEIVELDMDQQEQSMAESLEKQSPGKKKKKHKEKNSSKEGGDHGDSCIVDETVGETDQLDMAVSDINEEQPRKKKRKKNKENKINENDISNYTDKDEVEICDIDESGDGKKHKKKKHKSRS